MILVPSLSILFVVLGHIDQLWYGNGVEMAEGLSESQLQQSRAINEAQETILTFAIAPSGNLPSHLS
jgi:hypothetical protein